MNGVLSALHGRPAWTGAAALVVLVLVLAALHGAAAVAGGAVCHQAGEIPCIFTTCTTIPITMLSGFFLIITFGISTSQLAPVSITRPAPDKPPRI